MCILSKKVGPLAKIGISPRAPSQFPVVKVGSNPHDRQVHESQWHPADFQFVQRCLEGDAAAVEELITTHRAAVQNYLIGAGAEAQIAQEITENVWVLCLVEEPERPSALRRYTGECALRTWLCAVALNTWMNVRRREQRWRKLMPDRLREAPEESHDGRPQGPVPATPDAPLLELMRAALQRAFESCPAEDFVLLHLAYTNQLSGAQLARVFQCSEPTMSRRLAGARGSIAVATMAHIRQTDPWLDLKWEDFVELCHVVSPACFGME